MHISKFLMIAAVVFTSFSCQPTTQAKKSNSSSSCVNIPQPVYSQISTVVSNSCGAGCHDGSNLARQNLLSELGLTNNAANSLTRLQNNTMPASPKTIGICEKQNLMNYLALKTGTLPMTTMTPSVLCTPVAYPTYAQVSLIVQNSCATANCHNGTNTMRQNLTTEANLKYNKTESITRLQNGTMPASPNTIAPCDKQLLITYLQTAT